MPNITISLDEDLLKAGRRYAEKHHRSMNALIRRLLEQTIKLRSKDWFNECFELMDRSQANSGGQRWKWEDLNDGQVFRGVRIENPLKDADMIDGAI